MAFTATGYLLGREVSVTWNDGELAGDPMAVAYLQGLANGLRGKPVGMAGFVSHEDHLSKPLAVLALFEFAFQPGVNYSGDLPTCEKTPQATIG